MTTITETNVQAIADEVNARFAAGEALTVGGRKIDSWGLTKPAQVWGTGSLSVDVRTRKGNSITQIWFKQGQTFALDI